MVRVREVELSPICHFEGGVKGQTSGLLTSVSPERTSNREIRLCPSLRSSYRSVT